ncbi:MAG: DNA repair protein RadC [Bacteroidales bacterium]|nr:DNA repair protein RadC [Bacteroidales bacterium]
MTTESISIKDWNKDERPREKMMQLGPGALSDAELLAILLGSGCQKMTAVDVARRLLRRYDDDLQQLGRCTLQEMTRLKGIGPARAASVAAALELGRRRMQAAPAPGRNVTSSRDIYNLFQPILADLVHEEFWVALLSRTHRIISHCRISQGGLSSTVADVRIILKRAVDRLASGIVLCHNHPSGNLMPSKEDIFLTAQVKSGAKMVDIVLLDHLIVAHTGYYSFADHGMI